MYIGDEQHFSFRLAPINNSQQESIIRVEKLEFVGSGLDHVVFERIDNPGELVIFKRDQAGKKKEENSFSNKTAILETIYESALEILFPQLGKYRSQRKRMYLPVPIPACIYQNLENKVKQKAIQRDSAFPIDRQTQIVYMGTSVFESEYNTIVEFKPKTVLPDKYTHKALEQISHTQGLSLSDLKSLISTASPSEKLRWYKKEKLGEQGKKINMNPLLTFNPNTKQPKAPEFTGTKCFKNIPSLTPEQMNLLNLSILQSIHGEREMLESIFLLQSLFPYSPEYLQVSENSISKINQKQLTTELFTVIKKIVDAGPKVDFSTFEISLMNQTCLSEKSPSQWSSQCALLLFLISLTWKDISLVYLAKFDGMTFRNPKIKIIDDYLKGIEKVEENVKKDKKLLSKYIRHKRSE